MQYGNSLCRHGRLVYRGAAVQLESGRSGQPELSPQAQGLSLQARHGNMQLQLQQHDPQRQTQQNSKYHLIKPILGKITSKSCL